MVVGKIPPKYFCDRKRETDLLVRTVTNGNNLVLISPRRMGKSCLISHCFAMEPIASEYNTFYIDILQTRSIRELALSLSQAIFGSLAPLGKKLLQDFIGVLKSLHGHFGFDATTGFPTFDIQLGDVTAPEHTLEEIFAFLDSTEKRNIVAIDEFQQVGKYPETHTEALLRSHIQRMSHTNFIFSGSERHMMQRMFSDSDRPFYQSASMMSLLPISPDVYRDFAIDKFRERQKDVNPDTVMKIYRMMRGFTFYMQKMLNITFSNTKAGERAGNQAAKEALEEMLFSNDDIFRSMTGSLNIRQKELFFAIARAGNVSQPTSGAFIREHALASASAVQNALSKLTELDIIAKDPETGWHISDPLLDIWLRTTLLGMPMPF